MDNEMIPPTVAVLDKKIKGVKESMRIEQKELLDWFKIDRGRDTLTYGDAYYLLFVFVQNGYDTIKKLDNVRNEVWSSMDIRDDLKTWLSVWLPQKYTGEEADGIQGQYSLEGWWEDEFRGRLIEFRRVDGRSFYCGVEKSAYQKGGNPFDDTPIKLGYYTQIIDK